MGNLLAQLTLLGGGLALLCLLVLHFASPEFHPSWRMVSEYALGRFNPLLLAFFVLWGVASLLLAAVLWNEVTGIWARIGVMLLVVSAVGEVMGGVFDLKHKLHGLAFGIGVPSFPIAALLIGHHLAAQAPWSARAAGSRRPGGLRQSPAGARGHRLAAAARRHSSVDLARSLRTHWLAA
jgi:hypothetical protein